MAYSLKHRLVSWVSNTFFDGVTYTVRNGFNKGLRRRGGLGWLPFEQTNAEIEFWKSLDLRDKVVYDIGAFHGLLTIFFARSAKHVVAWEPTIRNRQRLLDNIRVNRFQNVTVRPYGLGSSADTVELRFHPAAPGTASADADLGQGSLSEKIEIRTLDEETGLPTPNFIKIDTEGFELEVLRGAEQSLATKPDLFLEMHGVDMEDKARRVRAIVEFLWARGYRDLLHIESASVLSPETATVAAQGHIYARPSRDLPGPEPGGASLRNGTE